MPPSPFLSALLPYFSGGVGGVTPQSAALLFYRDDSGPRRAIRESAPRQTPPWSSLSLLGWVGPQYSEFNKTKHNEKTTSESV